MCGGGPHFEFYKAGKLHTSISLHHGRSIRWRWYGDAVLTGKSAENLARWLNKLGIPGPMMQYVDNKRSDRAAKRRYSRWQEIAGEEIARLLITSRDSEETAEKIDEQVSGGIKSLALYFKLFGCDLITWNRIDATFYVMESHLFDDLSFNDVSEVYDKSSKDMDVVYGIGRWMFYFGHWKDLDEDERQFAVDKIATQTLQHPQKLNRMITLSFLRQIGTPQAKQMLRDLLTGTKALRKASKEDISEPHGGMNSERIKPWVNRNVSDRAYSALLLAHLEDSQSLSAIKELLSDATKDDREILQQAVVLLK